MVDALRSEAHDLVDELAQLALRRVPGLDVATIDQLHTLVDHAIDGSPPEESEEAADAIAAMLHSVVDILDALIALPGLLDLVDGQLAHKAVTWLLDALKPSPERLKRRAKVLEDKAWELALWGKTRKSARKYRNAARKERRATRLLS